MFDHRATWRWCGMNRESGAVAPWPSRRGDTRRGVAERDDFHCPSGERSPAQSLSLGAPSLTPSAFRRALSLASLLTLKPSPLPRIPPLLSAPLAERRGLASRAFPQHRSTNLPNSSSCLRGFLSAQNLAPPLTLASARSSPARDSSAFSRRPRKEACARPSGVAGERRTLAFQPLQASRLIVRVRSWSGARGKSIRPSGHGQYRGRRSGCEGG